MKRPLFAAVIIALVTAACNGSATTSEAPTTAAEVAPSAREVPTTAEIGPSRVVFLAGLDDAGWATYVDETAGWSVRYPGDWAVGEATEPGRRLTLVTPSAGASLIIVIADDAASDDESSWDYLVRHARAAVDSGEFRPVDDEALSLLHLDVDFDGRVDPQDIVGVDLVVTSDAEGNPGLDKTVLTSWYAYYDPAGSSDAYAFETVGQDQELTRYADDIVFSFEPPGGYPGRPSTQAAPSDPYALFGEVVAVVDTAIGAVTWRHASSIPLDLVEGDQFPDPGHRWENRWLAVYENAQDATGACFEIFEGVSGYLGLGPCAADWLPQHSWYVEGFGGPRIWEPDNRKWNWLNEIWFSPDGVDWNQTTKAFPDSTEVVAAEPWSVAEKDGQ